MISPDVAHIAQLLETGFRDGPPLGGTLAFDFGHEGGILILGKQAPVHVGALDNSEGVSIALGTGGADCVVRVDLATFKAMLAGSADIAAVYVQGKLKISGDVALAARLGPALRAGREARGEPER